MRKKQANRTRTLLEGIWGSYLRTALIPLIVIELVFVGIYFFMNGWLQKETIHFLKESTHKQLTQLCRKETGVIGEQLSSITHAAELYRTQMARALSVPASLKTEDAYRLKYSPQGVYYTDQNKKENGAAVFYSGIVPIGQEEREKVASSLTLENLMKDILHSEPLATSIYLNTYDSLNVIYPYFDVINQYTPLVDIPKYNFYYEADAKHNPERKVKWTDAYLDPAGRGWMASAIAPIYNENILEGVIGIDITINTIINQILTMDVPWQGYSMLVGKDGTILALPKNGEKDWHLNELTSHHYAAAVLKDTFKPAEFNLYKRKNLAAFAKQVAENEEGFSSVNLNGSDKEISWATIPNTGWKLLTIVSKHTVYAEITNMKQKLLKIGTLMILGLAVFYCIFVCMVMMRARQLSSKVIRSLNEINDILQKIGAGDYYQSLPNIKIKEIQETVFHLVHMGGQLGDANESLLETQEKLRIREANLQALINSIDDIIIELDENGIFLNVWANDEGNLAHAFIEGEARDLDCIMESNSAMRIKKKIKQAIETKCAQTVEYELETCKGRRWFEARISLITSETRTVVATARDITEYKAIEEAIDIGNEL